MDVCVRFFRFFKQKRRFIIHHRRFSKKRNEKEEREKKENILLVHRLVLIYTSYRIGASFLLEFFSKE